MAVYLDDCASGVTIYGNVFRGCSRAAFIGGGQDNLVENNIFLDCSPAVMIDGRGLDPSEVWHNMVHRTMRKSLDAMNPLNPPYSTHYPELAKVYRYYESTDGAPPAGNRVARNICWGGEWLKIHWHADPEMVVVEDNLVGEDPLFEEGTEADFALRAESPAHPLGFKAIPFERIGLYLDEHRSEQ
jgi:hypothetical protein